MPTNLVCKTVLLFYSGCEEDQSLLGVFSVVGSCKRTEDKQQIHNQPDSDASEHTDNSNGMWVQKKSMENKLIIASYSKLWKSLEINS